MQTETSVPPNGPQETPLLRTVMSCQPGDADAMRDSMRSASCETNPFTSTDGQAGGGQTRSGGGQDGYTSGSPYSGSPAMGLPPAEYPPCPTTCTKMESLRSRPHAMAASISP